MSADDYRKIVHEDISIACNMNNTSEAEEFLSYATGLLVNGEEFDDFTECHCEGGTPNTAGYYCIDGYSIDETDGIVSTQLNKEKFDKITLLIKHYREHKHLSQYTINVASYVDFYDQYGDKWTDDSTKPDLIIEPDNTEGCFVNENNLVINKAGEYNVKVSSNGLQNPLIGTLSFNVEEDNRYYHGDVDGDEKITVLDVTMIQLHIAQLFSVDEEYVEQADADKDNEITIFDATVIQRFIAQLIPSL